MKPSLIFRSAAVSTCLAGAVFAAAGCGGSSSPKITTDNTNAEAKAVAEQFKDAWGTDQGEKACDLMTQQAEDHQASLVKDKTCPARVDQFNRLYDHLKQPSPETLKIVDVTVTGNLATVVLQATTEKPERSILMTQDDGRWRVTDFTF